MIERLREARSAHVIKEQNKLWTAGAPNMKKLLVIFLLALSGCDSSSSHNVALQVTGTGTVSIANIIYEVGNSGWVGAGPGWISLPWNLTTSLQHGPVSLNAVTDSGTSISGSLTVTILIDGAVWKTATVNTTGEQEVASTSGIL